MTACPYCKGICLGLCGTADPATVPADPIAPPAGETIRSTQDGGMEAALMTGQSPVDAASTTTVPAHAELRERLLAWSQNSPDPDFFRGDALSAVLSDCGDAAAQIATLKTALASEIAKRWNNVHPHYTELEAQIATLERERDEARTAHVVANKWCAEVIRNAEAAESNLAEVKAELDMVRAGRHIISEGSFDTGIMYMEAQARADALESSCALLREALTVARTTLNELFEHHLHNSESGCEAWADVGGVGTIRLIDAALKGGSDGAANKWPDATVAALWDERDRLRIDLTAAREEAERLRAGIRAIADHNAVAGLRAQDRSPKLQMMAWALLEQPS